MDEEPPNTRPRGQFMTLSFKNLSGSDLKPQLNFLVFIGIPSAVGIFMKIFLSEPPASIKRTLTDLSSLSLAATIAPAEPDQMTM